MQQPVVQTIVVQQAADGEEPIVVRKHVFGQPKTRPGFVPAAVARQRARFAHHGRKAAARRQKVLEARGLA
jgi:hypothetical protein